jgi:hypothetical protein
VGGDVGGDVGGAGGGARRVWMIVGTAPGVRVKLGVGVGTVAESVGRGGSEVTLTLIARVAVGQAVDVAASVAVARGDAVAEGCRLGEGRAVATLFCWTTVAVNVLVADA